MRNPEPEQHPLMVLAQNHEKNVVEALMRGDRGFPVLKELRNPARILVVFRKSYGNRPDGKLLLGNEYYAAGATHFQDCEGRLGKPFSTFAQDPDGNPAPVEIEAYLYRTLLERNPKDRNLVASHLAWFENGRIKEA